MSEKTTALVTGANKGIGYEIAAALGGLGFRVGVGARDGNRLGTAVDQLRAAGVDAFGVLLDVTDDASVAAAADLLERQEGRLDVLVNNAGMSGPTADDWSQDPTTIDLDVVRSVVDLNVYGVVRTTNALLPLLRRAPSPRIVNVSSSMGSLTRPVGPISAVYGSSKTFLNAVTVQYARQLADTPVLVNLACPGLVATDFTGFVGRSPAQGAATPVRLATLPDGGPSGTFSDDDGEIPW